MFTKNLILVCVVSLAFSGVAQAAPITFAEAANNFVAATAGQTTKTATLNGNGLTDSSGLGAGAGYWNYYGSTDAGSGAPGVLTLLTWKSVGSPTINTYGGTAQFGTAAVAKGASIFGSTVPAADELAIHPGDNAANASTILSWTAGTGEATTTLGISASITRDNYTTDPNDNSAFLVYVNGVQKYNLSIAGTDISTHTYSDSGLTIAAGQTVDLVYWRNGRFNADEARIKSTITGTIPEPGSLSLLGLFGGAFLLRLRRRNK